MTASIHNEPTPQALGAVLKQLAALTPAQQTLLRQVGNHSDPVTAASLAEQLGLHVSSIRETIDTLISLGLVQRHTLPSQGRGRPSLGYTTNLLVDPSFPAEMLSQFAEAMFMWLRSSDLDHVQVCQQIGAHWGDEALRSMGVPDHAQYGRASKDFCLENHMEKICLFLSALGFQAKKTPEHPTSFTLSGSPLSSDDGVDPLALIVRRGLVERILDRTATSNATYTYREDHDNPLLVTVELSSTHLEAPLPEVESMTTIRFFGGSAEVAGTETLTLDPDSSVDTVSELIDQLGETNSALRSVLAVSTFLINADVAGLGTHIPQGCTVDVLPPFAGG